MYPFPHVSVKRCGRVVELTQITELLTVRAGRKAVLSPHPRLREAGLSDRHQVPGLEASVPAVEEGHHREGVKIQRAYA